MCKGKKYWATDNGSSILDVDAVKLSHSNA